MTELSFEKSVSGRYAVEYPACDVPEHQIDEGNLRKSELVLPELSQPEVVRHFTGMSKNNHGVDSGFYPLGSCTMKYNSKINEFVARLGGFSSIHPLMPEEEVQGSLELQYKLQKMLDEITGMDYFTLQPAAGAQGELTGLMIIKSYHEDRKDFGRKKIIIPDSSHGTNPASATMCGFEPVVVKSDKNGNMDIEELKKQLNGELAGLMLTNPNTLGLFEVNIVEIAKLIHEAGGLLYYDGANANAILGKTRPGDMGFDVVHLNLHKTFSTPHGGGGPGSGPVGVKAFLGDFLPKPTVERKGDTYAYKYDIPKSIGKVRSFYGNFGVMVRAYTYILANGAEGLKEATEAAVLNANYLKALLKEDLGAAFNRICMHEFVTGPKLKEETGVSTMDFAKRMLDFGVHPPTVYFPLIVKESMMFEPTESESKQSLDRFAGIIKQIASEAKTDPQLLKEAPHDTIVGRLDDVAAARKPILKYTKA